TAEQLRNAGHDALHTGEIGLATADDSVILDWGRRDDRIIVTLDADFHALMALSGHSQPSVIRIRIEGLLADQLTRLLENVIQAYSSELIPGALVSVTPGNVRIRKLPIKP